MGFLLGGTAGRTTLAGKRLQRQDGHSHILAYLLPNVRACDPVYAYELAAIIRDGLRRMYAKNEALFYYITLMNENYPQPPTPKNAEPGIRKGLYLCRSAPAEAQGPRVQLLGSGAILNEVLKAQAILAERYAVAVDLWSATSYKQLYHEASDAERWNLLHPEKPAKIAWIARCFGSTQGPIVAASEGTPAICSEMDAPDVRGPGTDGYGRSDGREALRKFFEVDAAFTTWAAMAGLAKERQIPLERLSKAQKELDIHPDKLNPMYA